MTAHVCPEAARPDDHGCRLNDGTPVRGPHACWHCHDDPPPGHTCPCCGEAPAAVCAACGGPLPSRKPGRGGMPRVTCSKQCRQRLYDRRHGRVERGSIIPDHGTLARYRGNSSRPPCRCTTCRSAARAYRYRYPGAA